MRSAVLLQLLAATASWALAKRDYDAYDYYAVHLRRDVSPADLAAHLGFEFDGQIGELRDHYLLKAPKHSQDLLQDALLKHKRRKRELGSSEHHVLDAVRFNQKQERRQRLKDALLPRADTNTPPLESYVEKGKEIAQTLDIKDPIFQEQWHIYNHVYPGNDLNVTGVWLQGITGKNSTVCIVDDGLDMDSDDIRDNYFPGGSYDFNDQVEEPKPRLSDDTHGTRCAGEVAAVRNDVCGVGVAYDARIAAERILSGPISDADEATSLIYSFQENQIYSCSWGPTDDGQSMDAPGILIQRSMITGIQQGRGGKGSIYVFAIGNGAANDDNCNFDGYTNSIYSVSVGAFTHQGEHPYYSEACSAAMVPWWDIRGRPLAAGVYALVLSVRPDLNWRDIQWLTVMTAVPGNLLEQDKDGWVDTPFGRKYSHQFGYGKLDAWAMVETAKNWTSVKPQAWLFSPWLHIRQAIPQGDKGLTASFNVTKEMMQTSNLERLEHVTVTMNVEHQRRGDLSVELRSPAGIVSHLATHRRQDNYAGGYDDWTFMSVAHWGESAIGTWTVVVKDTEVNDKTGNFTDFRLKLWGESIDASRAKLLPLPGDDDDADHDKETVTSSVTPGTTSVAITSDDIATSDPALTSIPLPTSVLSTTPVNSPTDAATTTTSPTPEPTSLPDSSQEEDKETEAEHEHEYEHEHFLPSAFPTFGVSKRTQVWIYGAATLILVFCVSLRRNARDEYEFEVLDDGDDDDGAANGAVPGAKAKKRRGGELYDAFAEDSADEDVFSLGDEEDEERRYRDERGEGRARRCWGRRGV
ncbi:pheromone processing endoprotease [Taxawa tesnikishii (nom. ined.)]|nr:pheromone processing endoprotease [Dothideales sp. JES 119]